MSLYEYSNRVGGRFYTVKFPGIPDVNIEMGAMRFKPLGKCYLKPFGIQLNVRVMQDQMQEQFELHAQIYKLIKVFSIACLM